MAEPIKVGVDLHGVIDANTSLFRYLSFILKQGDVKIYVISGPPTENVKKELEALNLVEGTHYDEIYTIVDFLQTQPDIEMWKDEKDTWWTDDENWWGSKAKICKILGIDVMIDNTDKYMSYFEGSGIKFILYTGII